jgi:predicted peptidase
MNKQKQQKKVLDKKLTWQVNIKYLLYLPWEYDTKEQKWPLIVFLHGAGERGDDLEKVKRHGIPKILEKEMDFPFIVVSPQCPAKTWWTEHFRSVIALIDYIKESYNVDSSRIYLTGMSMGGFGTWFLAELYPEYFAAIAPVCGGGEQIVASRLEMPIWAFHGAKDNLVPLKRSQEMIDAVKAAGGDVKFTVYPDLKHECWTRTYENEELYKWFLSHKTNKK